MKTPLVLFDSDCNFCRYAITCLLKMDSKKRLTFAPLSGETAQIVLGKSLKSYLNKNTLVLIEGNKKYIRMRAIFRLLWIINPLYRLIGWLYIFPCGFDWIYRIIAQLRISLGPKTIIELPSDKRIHP